MKNSVRNVHVMLSNNLIPKQLMLAAYVALQRASLFFFHTRYIAVKIEILVAETGISIAASFKNYKQFPDDGQRLATTCSPLPGRQPSCLKDKCWTSIHAENSGAGPLIGVLFFLERSSPGALFPSIVLNSLRDFFVPMVNCFTFHCHLNWKTSLRLSSNCLHLPLPDGVVRADLQPHRHV